MKQPGFDSKNPTGCCIDFIAHTHVSLIDWKRYRGWELKKNSYIYSRERGAALCGWWINHEFLCKLSHWRSVLIFIIDVLKVELLQVVFDILLNYFLSQPMEQKIFLKRQSNVSCAPDYQMMHQKRKKIVIHLRACHFYVENLHYFHIGARVPSVLVWICGAKQSITMPWSRNDLNFTQVYKEESGVKSREQLCSAARRGIIIAKGIKYPWLEAKCSGASERECALVLWKYNALFAISRVMAGTVTRAREQARDQKCTAGHLYGRVRCSCISHSKVTSAAAQTIGSDVSPHAPSPLSSSDGESSASHRMCFCNQSAFF